MLLLLLVRGITLVKLPLCLYHGLQGFLISSKLIDFDLSALIVEIRQALIRLGLAVELDNSLHDIRVVVPVLVAQEVTRHDPNLGRAGSLGEADHSTHIARFQEALETFDLFVGKCVHLGSKLEVIANDIGGIVQY